MKLHTNSLVTRLILSFLGLSLITILIVAYMSYNRARASLTEAVYDRLTATLELKEDALNNWIEEKMDDLLFVWSIPEVNQKFLAVLKNTSDSRSPEYQDIYGIFHSLLINHPDFTEIFLLSRYGGEILISSNLKSEGDYRISDTYFIEGLNGIYLQDIYLSPVTFKPTITLATPIRDESLNSAGVLAAHLDLERMDRIIFQSSGLGETGEAYLVDSTNTFVAGRGFGRAEYPRGAHSEGIKRALEGKSGTGLYRNYAGENVVGAYRWIQKRNLALIAELSQSEAFYPARRLAGQILILGLVVSIFLAQATRMLARRITRPILAVKGAADRIAKGDRVTRAPVRSADEVGDLAKAFNQMVDEIQESEERFRTIFDTIPDIVTVIRLSDQTFVDVNREFEEVSGYTPDEVIGRTTLDIGSWADLRSRERFYATLEKEGRVRNIEIDFVLKDGEMRTGLASADLINLSGEPHLLAIIRDITQLKEAEKAARESEEQFRATFEQAEVGMAHVGLDGRWLRVNDKLCTILGYTAEELYGMSFRDVTHPDDIEENVVLGEEAKKDGIDNFTMEKRYIRKDGTVVWTILTSALLRWDDGSPRHFIGIIQDINDRKKAERALKESEERYRILFNAGSDAIFVFDIDDDGMPGKLFTVNDVACRVLGRTFNELAGLSLTDILSGPREPAAMKQLISTIMEKGKHTFEQSFINNEGVEIPVEINANLFDFHERPIIYAMARDLTDRMKAEEERKKIQTKLIQANKMTSLGLMVSSFAHEINNPNNTIMFNLRRFAKTWEDSVPILNRYYKEHGDFNVGGMPYSELRYVLPQLVAGTLDSSEMIGAIIENLKGFVRQSSDAMDFDVDISDVVQRAINLIECQARKGVGRIETELPERLPCVKGNPQKLVQVAINLVSNALESLTDDHQRVILRTGRSRSGNQVFMEVKDQGRGMTPDELTQATEPFFTTKLESGGTGLGLSITRLLLDEHNAQLDIDSEPGVGTTVTATFQIHGLPS